MLEIPTLPRLPRLLSWLMVVLTPLLGANLAMAEWNPDPLENVPLSLADDEKNNVFMVSDDAGGAIVVWEDKRSGNWDVYAQRIDVNGNPLWATDGIPVCTAGDNQYVYRSSTSTTGFTPVITDGEGGVFIVWQDARLFSFRLNDIYCQHLDADGQAQFPVDGLLIAGGNGTEDQPTMCRDGAGGAIIVWQDKNADPVFYDLYGQRIDPEGNKLWNEGSPQIIAADEFSQDAPTICPDGTGGAFLAWTDSRTNLNDVYAQHLDAEGASLWTANGVPVAQHENGQDAISIFLSEDGSPILAWVDRRTGEPDIYAQKLDPLDGSGKWGPGGYAVCTAVESQYRPAPGSDGQGGAIIAWYDFRDAPSGPPWDLNIFAQRIRVGGAAVWPTNGVVICAADDAQRDADLCSDGGGGAYVVWEDNRLGTGREDIYAQQVDSLGTIQLEEDGLLVCAADNNQNRPDVIRGAGGLLTAWKDDRDVLYEPDVYADRVLTTDSAVIGVNRVLIDFGVANLEAASDTFLVSNVGGSDLVIHMVTLAQENPAFMLHYPRALPDTLTPGFMVPVIVEFAPAIGRRDTLVFSDEVQVHHDASDQASPVTVRLRGAAVATAVPGVEPLSAPAILHLSIQPNPFNPRTTIVYDLPHDSRVILQIHDLAGRLVRKFGSGGLESAGIHRVDWDGRDDGGRAVASGIYICRLEATGTSTSRRMVIMR